MGSFARKQDQQGVGGSDHYVLLGVSTWEHSWLRQEGIGGKEAFLHKWWDRIDWEEVIRRRNEAEKSSEQASATKKES